MRSEFIAFLQGAKLHGAAQTPAFADAERVVQDALKEGNLEVCDIQQCMREISHSSLT